MRALLVVNPKATTTSERSRDVLVRALRSQVDLTVEYTLRRGHATTLAKAAAESGVDVVVTLGGDGTVNEAVNGLMTAAPSLSGSTVAPCHRSPPGVRLTTGELAADRSGRAGERSRSGSC